MNRQRLLKVIEDMTEVVENLISCKSILEADEKDEKVIFIEFGLKQIFVDFFITVESFTSMILKEIKEFKIGIDMKTAISILKSKAIIDENMYMFLNEARLLRNRISHRYKEPSRSELLEFINKNINKFGEVIELSKSFL